MSSDWKSAVWSNGKRWITGYYRYNWAADRFTIELDMSERITGQKRCFALSGDTPEWGNYKLQRSAETINA